VGVMETLLHGTLGHCPDCADERLLLPTDGYDGYCCTACDAAVFPFEVVAAGPAGERAARDLPGRLAG
jgi:hypothetical protein